MSQFDDDEAKPWTDDDLKEAMRRINAGEIGLKEVEVCYGISPRTIHRQRAIENMRAQLNPEKAKKMKSVGQAAPKKDPTILRKPVDISCSSVKNVADLLDSGTEEIKQLLNNECDIIYECKVCKNLFRSLVNFISHKRSYCCDTYNVIHLRASENDDGFKVNDAMKGDERLKYKDNVRDLITKPLRVTCKKDLTSILKRITALPDVMPDEPVLKLQTIENTSTAYQVVHPVISSSLVESPRSICESTNSSDPCTEIVESKKEAMMATGTVDTESSNSVGGKRFRCPVCEASFTIKKSVIRHLRAVHNKSADQLEILKGQILTKFFKNIADGSENKEAVEATDKALPNKVTEAPVINVIESTTSCLDKNSGDWQKRCPLCGDRYTNRKSFAAHMKGCRRRVASQRGKPVESSNTTKTSPLVPVVSLTPIACTSISPTETNGDCFTNDHWVSADGSRNVSFSLPASSTTTTATPTTTTVASSSKKIGIQVRMNYCKDSQTSSAACVTTGGGSSSAASSVVVVGSRRNVTAPMMAAKETMTTESRQQPGLESASDRYTLRSVGEVFSPQQDNDLKETVVANGPREDQDDDESKTLPPRNKASIYCEDCGATFALNDYKCDLGVPGLARNYRCALRNCDFRCDDNRQLLPHMTAKHEVMLEGELAEVKSFFVAESTGRRRGTAAGGNSSCCSKPNILDSESRVKGSGGVWSASDKAVVDKSQAMPPKVLVCTIKPRKKGVVGTGTNATRSGNHDVEAKNPNNAPASTNQLHKTTATDVIALTKLANSTKGVALQSTQNQKKRKNNSTENKYKVVRKKKSAVEDNVAMVNGVQLSSDEENEIKTMTTSSKLNYDASLRKQNSFSAEAKMDKPLQPKHVFSPSSSVPDSDLNPSMMSQENLKESIMTIIFGKNVPTEKIQGSVSNSRKALPASSVPSFQNNREQRARSVRIAKRAIIAKSVPSAGKRDKVPKIPLSNKINASR